MFTPVFLLETLSPMVAIAMVSFAVGIIGLVVTLIMLIVKAIRKKALKRVLIALLVSFLLCVLGIVLVCKSGAVDIHSNDTQSSGSSLPIGFRAGKVLTFSTTDKDGNVVDSSIFKDSKVTLINRWEPWCENCIEEMPDLQELYEKYGSDGLNIIGVYSDEDNLQEMLDKTGVQYPIICATEDFDFFGSAYPCSVFVDSDGCMLDIPKKYRAPMMGNCLVLGYRSGEDWEDLILGFLGD